MEKAGLVPNAIHGFCDYRFRAVRDAFAANFDQQLEVGASVAIELEGKTVVDLWAGTIDTEGTRPWQPDTLVNLYSTTKGITAVCANRLLDQQLLDLDAPVATYWPEFAQARKTSVLVRHLLNHQAGLPAIREPLEAGAHLDWDMMTGALAKTETWWEPGTCHGYHLMTFGWLVGEVVRRMAQESLGTYLREQVTGPLGIDLYIGLPASEEHRVAAIIPRPHYVGEASTPTTEARKDKESVTYKAMVNPKDMMAVGSVNTRAWRMAEIPAANGQGNARGLSRLYGVLANGGARDGFTLLSADAIRAAATTQSEGIDAVLGIPTRFGLGFALGAEFSYFGPNPHTLGHPGAGGSCGFADLDAHLGFGYAMNQLVGSIGQEDIRRRRLIDAAYESLGGAGESHH